MRCVQTFIITVYTTRYLLKDKFARHTGYNEVGELNNIIIIYPQVTAIIDNPLGCWDWWGYTVKFYRKSRQVATVLVTRGSIAKVVGVTSSGCFLQLSFYRFLRNILVSIKWEMIICRGS